MRTYFLVSPSLRPVNTPWVFAWGALSACAPPRHSWNFRTVTRPRDAGWGVGLTLLMYYTIVYQGPHSTSFGLLLYSCAETISTRSGYVCLFYGTPVVLFVLIVLNLIFNLTILLISIPHLHVLFMLILRDFKFNYSSFNLKVIFPAYFHVLFMVLVVRFRCSNSFSSKYFPFHYFIFEEIISAPDTMSTPGGCRYNPA